MIVEDPVEFDSDGLALRGTLLRAEGAPGPGPAVVLSHGWSGAVNERMLPLARLLAGSGYVALPIDHRGFGRSAGRRARCDPSEQVRDLSNALTFLASLDIVDGDALGVVGVSFGGAIAVGAGAVDERVRATVSIVGIGDAGRWLRSLRSPEEWTALEARLADDPTASVDFSVLMPLPPGDATDAELAIMRRKYPEGYPLENLDLAARFRPEQLIGDISPRAVLLLTCADDTVVPPSESRSMYERAGEPRRLEVLPTGGHGGPLGPLVEPTAAVVVPFLDQHVRRPT